MTFQMTKNITFAAFLALAPLTASAQSAPITSENPRAIEKALSPQEKEIQQERESTIERVERALAKSNAKDKADKLNKEASKLAKEREKTDSESVREMAKTERQQQREGREAMLESSREHDKDLREISREVSKDRAELDKHAAEKSNEAKEHGAEKH